MCDTTLTRNIDCPSFGSGFEEEEGGPLKTFRGRISAKRQANEGRCGD